MFVQTNMDSIGYVVLSNWTKKIVSNLGTKGVKLSFFCVTVRCDHTLTSLPQNSMSNSRCLFWWSRVPPLVCPFFHSPIVFGTIGLSPFVPFMWMPHAVFVCLLACVVALHSSPFWSSSTSSLSSACSISVLTGMPPKHNTNTKMCDVCVCVYGCAPKKRVWWNLTNSLSHLNCTAQI